MATIFKLPELGEGLAEGEIVKWHVKPGDEVKEDDVMVEIQSDKSVEEIPSPTDGKVTQILAKEGDTVEVGQPLIEFDGDGKADTAADKKEEPKAEAAPAAASDAPAADKPAAYYQFKLPELGEGLAEGEIVKWHVKPGDEIKEDDTLLEVQSDKSVEEIPSPVTGKVVKIIAEEGKTVEVGDPLIEIDAPDANPTEASAASAPAAPEAKAAADKPAPAPAPASGAKVQVAQSTPDHPILAMPSVRLYAREKGVDLAQVTPTGSHGHITKTDVDQASSQPQASAASPAAPTAPAAQPAAAAAKPLPKHDNETREKMSMTRKAIAKAMTKSKHTAPHVTLFDEVEVSKLMKHRKQFKPVAADKGIKLTFLAYVVKALVIVLRDFPTLNASMDDASEEIVYKHYFNIGIATDTPHGLYVPNIKEADKKSIFAIAKDIKENAEKAAANRLKPDEMANGSMTISNIGSIGGGWFTPVINYPEVAILGFGRISKEPYVNEDGEVAVGSIMKLSLSFDHRLIDGATAQKAMNELKQLLADPELMLMEG